MYNLGVTLSGGGIKGFAHAGALKALEEFGLKPQILSGTSAGAIVSALYAAGNTPEDISKEFQSKGFNNFVELTLPIAGILNPKKFKSYLRKQLPYDTIQDLPIPIRVVATDLDHGKSVTFTSGNIVDCVMASSSVPVLFTPQKIGGVHYVDGGVFNNFPVNVIREDCEYVIGINVSPLVSDKYKQSIIEIAERSYRFMFRANTFAQREQCDILIEIEDALKYGALDLDKVSDIFDLGYKVTKQELEKYPELIDKIKYGG